MTDQKRRIGIYGGTFAPPHIAHVRAAAAFLRAAELDELLVMPDSIPPHKQIDPGDDPRVRLAMTRAAFAGIDSRITVSDYEIQRAGVSYTSDTLAHFAGQGRLYFLCGTDMFLSLDTWRAPEKIFALAVIVCAMRENDRAAYEAICRKQEEFRSRYGAETMLLSLAPMELSSTAIRERVRRGESIDGMVAPAVARIIEENNLYRNQV